MRIVLVAAAALALTACGGSTESSNPEPSKEVKELERRDFTNIVPNEEGKYTKEYIVTAGICRVKIKWNSADGGWERLEGLNTEITATAMLAHEKYNHCMPPATTGTSCPAPGLSPS